MNAGWIGGIAGVVLGLVGGIIGTYFSIKNTQGPLERAFMIKAGLVCWAGLLLFLGLMVALPSPWRYLLWLPYGLLLPLGIRYGNREQQRIREREGRDHRKAPET